MDHLETPQMSSNSTTTSIREQAQFPTTSEEETTTSSSPSPGEESQAFLGVICSPSSDYLIKSILGEGAFGIVTECIKTATRERVAVKMIKESTVTEKVKNEVAILHQLRAFDADRFNFVRFNDSFSDREHIYLEFEKLDMSLHDFIARKPSRSLSVKEIRPILHQMATTLQLLRSQGIVHADLKPDNIMMVDSVNKPLKIKMIDFGLALHVSQSECFTYLQPRYYRSPEVILGNPFTTAIDMWSLGCIAAELFLGYVLYPGNCEYDMLRHMMHTQGKLPEKLLDDGHKTKYFFRRRKFRRKRQWRLKTSVEYGQESITNTYFKSLDDLNKVRQACHLSDEDTSAEIEDRENFVDLLKKMLHLDVDKRITPSQLLEDPFITMNDLADRYPNGFYVKSCCERMEVCRYQSQSTDDRDQQQSLNPQASTSNANLDQNVASQVPPAWHNRQEHPTIAGMASAVSSCLSLLEDQRTSEPQQISPSVDEERTQPELQLPFTSDETQSSKSRVQPGRKRSRNTFEASLSGERSPGSMPRKRRRKNSDYVQTLKDLPKNSKEPPTEATSSTAKVKPRNKRAWDTFMASHNDIRNSVTDSPEKKRMKMSLDESAPTQTELPQNFKEPSTEATSSTTEVKPWNKRTWDTFMASHSDVRTSVADSPVRKRMKMSLDESAPTQTGKGCNQSQSACDSSAEDGPNKCKRRKAVVQEKDQKSPRGRRRLTETAVEDNRSTDRGNMGNMGVGMVTWDGNA